MSDNKETKQAPAVDAGTRNPLLSILKDAAKWLHAAYDRPPQTPEAKAMLDIVDLSIQFADEASCGDAEQSVEAGARDATYAERAWEDHLDEQKRIPGMPGLNSRPCFLAGYRAALARASEVSICDALEWLATEVFAVDTWHRGSPSYEHDANWMKSEALRLIVKAKTIFALASEAAAGEPVIAGNIPRLFIYMHCETGNHTVINDLDKANGWEALNSRWQFVCEAVPAAPQPATVPAGWRLLPPKMTDAMKDAWVMAPSHDEGYRAMIAAAPQPASEQQAARDAPIFDPVIAAAGAVVLHWDEFGHSYGFEESVERLRSAILAAKGDGHAD